MQAQSIATNSEVQAVSNSTSLQYVETLLKAGLGCIAYLRGLLPYENFSEHRLSAGSFDNQTRTTISGVTIMSLKRGFTNEGDKILDYLEEGIFEAIKKQYLRRFIFAVYLDSKDPNNIVEAYTFNFQYYKVEGTNIVVPIMSLGNQLSKMTLHRKDVDPVVNALKQGNLPTLGDVKRSLKLMIKTLVTSISQMETLPKCRYGNFKLFFNGNTPDDYQPPHFRAGDPDSNRWFFTTHKAAEIPETTKIGNLETGWHGVSMKVVSVSSFLPSSTEDNNATFTGLTNCCPPKLTPVEEARLRVEDAELQRKDALRRHVVWDADADADAGEDEDALGEEISDEGIVLVRCSANGAMVPIGVRGNEGKILPIPVHRDHSKSNKNNIECGGHADLTPTHVGQLIVHPDQEESQTIPPTQEIDMRSPSPSSRLPGSPSLPPSDIHDSSSSFVPTQQECSLTKLRNGKKNQIKPSLSTSGSYSEHNAPNVSERILLNAMEDDGRIDCDCGTTVDDSMIFCEGGCNSWRHIWCMGYHGPQDKRLPLEFACFSCRLRRSPEWDIMAKETRTDMISRFKDLALFRRAIKMFEVHQPTTALQFREQIGCAAALVSQLLMRLEDEGFISTENAISEDSGSLKSHGRKGKKPAKNKGKKPQRELHKTKYVFLHSSKRTKVYLDYFRAEPQVENRLVGLTNIIMESRSTTRNTKNPMQLRTISEVKATISSETLDLDSQTQEPTQNLLTLAHVHHSETNLKRKAEVQSNNMTKKLKVFVGTAVDLCD